MHEISKDLNVGSYISHLMTKKHVNTSKTNTSSTIKDKVKQGQGQSKRKQDFDTLQKKKGRPSSFSLEEEKDTIDELKDMDNQLKQEPITTTSTSASTSAKATATAATTEMDPEMIEIYKLLDKFDTTKLEKFNTVLSMAMQKPHVVNTITFEVNQDVNLDIEYYNIASPQQLDLLFSSATKSVISTNGTVNGSTNTIIDQHQHQQIAGNSSKQSLGLKPLERYRFILEYKDYNSRSELDRITKSYGARRFRNYVGNQVMEQFHKPLLRKLLNQFEELKQRIKYNPEEINLMFTSFNFVGSTFIMMAIIKYFIESGTMEMNRKNGYNAEVEVIHTENPTFRISFKK